MPLPNFQDWLNLPEAERVRQVSALNAYAGEGRELLNEVLHRFRTSTHIGAAFRSTVSA